jgi:hypothetical protein
MTDTRDNARRYLLGETSPEESEVLERAILRSDEAVETVAEVEEALLEDYLDRRMAPKVRRRFEAHYLASPAHRNRLEVVRRLRRRAAGNRGARRVLPYLALAAVVVIGIVAFLDRGGPVVLSIPAVAQRSDGRTPTLHLDSGSTPVEIRLERLGDLPGARPAFVRDLDGKEIWRGTAVPDGAAYSVAVPAGTLPPGDWILEIGDEPVQRAYFRVVSP